MRFLGERLTEAAQGRGFAAIVTGEAGVGKTRLIDEFCAGAAGGIGRLVAVRCFDYARTPLGPFNEIVRSLREGAGMEPPSFGAEAFGSASDKLRAFDAILEDIRKASIDAPPLVIVLEDLQWAGETTLQMLEHLVRGIASLPLAVIAACRRDPATGDSQVVKSISALLRRDAFDVRLSALGRAETRTLLDAVHRQHKTLSRAAVARAEELAGGNPLYLEQLLEEAIEGGTSGEREAIPDVLKTIVLERLERLSPAATDVMIEAAVLGEQFDSRMLGEISQRQRSEVVSALQQAADAGLIVERSREGRYAFGHPLLRAALYSRLIGDVAATLHRAAAEALEREANQSDRLAELAYHWSGASEPLRAFRYNVAAGDAASASGDHRTAARFFGRALNFVSGTPLDRAEIESRLAEALFQDGALKESKAHFEAAIVGFVASGLADRVLSLVDSLFAAYWFDADTEGCMGFVSRTLALAESVEPRLGSVILVQATKYLSLNGLQEEAKALLSRVDTTQEANDAFLRSTLHELRAVQFAMEGRLEEAIALFESALHWSRSSGVPRLTTKIAGNLASCQGLAGDVGAAQRSSKYAYDHAVNERLSAVDQSSQALQYASLLFLGGKLSESASVVESVLGSSGAFERLRIRVAGIGIPIALLTKREDILSKCIDESTLEAVLAARKVFDVALIVQSYAQLYVHRNRAGAAAALLHEAMSIVRGANVRLELPIVTAKYGELSDARPARELLVEICARRPARLAQSYTAYFDAILAGRRGNWTERKRFARIAVTGFGELGIALYQADALELAGRQRDALALYRRMGASAEAARLERLFADRGKRGGVLTPRQVQIARFIGAGMSNAQTAQRLEIAEKTLESHLTAIHRRLGVESRGALVARLAEEFG